MRAAIRRPTTEQASPEGLGKIIFRVLVDIRHPAHIHRFKHILWRIMEMESSPKRAT